MTTNPPDKAIHLVLGAAGNRYVAYAGAIRALANLGYSFASVSSCSTGAAIAGFICAGLKPDEIEEHILGEDFNNLSRNMGIFAPLGMLTSPYAAHTRWSIADVVCGILGDDPKLKDLKIPFATLGVDLVSNDFVVYSSDTDREMRLSEAIRIATATPFAFPACERDGRIIVDAAIATQCPIWLAMLQSTRAPIFALKCSDDRRVEKPRSVLNYLSRLMTASARAGDEAILSVLPRLHRLEIHCPEYNPLLLRLSKEFRRALLDAGKTAVKAANLENTARTPFVQDASKHNLIGSVIHNYNREVIMNNNISVGGNAIINIESTLNNVQQTLQASAGLTADKKSELESLVTEFRREIDKIKESHAQEAALITQRLQEVVQGASQPPEKRNSSILKLSSKGLIEAAETVSEIVPNLLTTAGLIAKFVVGL